MYMATRIALQIALWMMIGLSGTSARLAAALQLPEWTILLAWLLLIPAGLLHVPLLQRATSRTGTAMPLTGLLWPARPLLHNSQLIAVNLGGMVLPTGYAFLLYGYQPVAPLELGLLTIIVALCSYLLSRPLAKSGIVLPVVVMAFITALAACWLSETQPLVNAYISGTIGVIVGADLMRYKDIKKMHSPFISVGGEGFFDAIVLNALLAIIVLSFICQ